MSSIFQDNFLYGGLISLWGRLVHDVAYIFNKLSGLILLKLLRSNSLNYIFLFGTLIVFSKSQTMFYKVI